MTRSPDSSPRGPEQPAGNLSPEKAVILLYHRVIELPADPQLLCVTPGHFAEHLEILRKRFNVMPLERLVRAMDRGRVPARSVVVTFDDGYADNLHNAKPLLESNGVPATVFVVSGALDSDREFWWDDIDRLLLQSSSRPDTLRLTVAGLPHVWHLGNSAAFDPSASAQSRGWNVLEKSDPTPRHAVYRELCTLLRPLPHRQRQDALNELAQWASAEAAGRPSHRALTAEELRRLADGDWVEVGAHTISHPVLASMRAVSDRQQARPGPHPAKPSGWPLESALAEIRDGKSDLENILGRPVTSFSYPYGQRSDYTLETVDYVRDCGFACACAAFSGLVRPDTDRFRLPRMIIRDWNGDAFATRLERWWTDA
jgi:peptidoglycan/xylan/chitin deacetylase (PgdA/CDA1 family)